MYVLDFPLIDLSDCELLQSHWSTGYYWARYPWILLALPQAPYLVILTFPQFLRGSLRVLRHPFRLRKQLRGAERIKTEGIMQHMEKHA